MEKIKNIFNKYCAVLAFGSPIVWPFIFVYIVKLLTFLPFVNPPFVNLMCLRSSGISQLFLSYVLLLIPSWVGLFISKKKRYYVASIIGFGTFWAVGVFAYYGMNCGIDWSQK